MKKLMLVMGLLSMVVFTHAAESIKINPVNGLDKQVSGMISVIQVQDVNLPADFEYSVTLKAKVGPSWAGIEVSCTATGATAEEALDGASLCIALAIRRLSKAIQ
jgi:hypothetical protein